MGHKVLSACCLAFHFGIVGQGFSWGPKTLSRLAGVPLKLPGVFSEGTGLRGSVQDVSLGFVRAAMVSGGVDISNAQLYTLPHLASVENGNMSMLERCALGLFSLPC